MNKTPPLPDDHLEDGDNQLEESSSNLIEKSIESVDSNDLEDYQDILSRVDSHEAKFGAEIKNLRNEVKHLKEEIEQRVWLKPSTAVPIGLTIIGILLAVFSYLSVRIDHVGGRIDNAGSRIDTIYQSHPPETKAVTDPDEEASKRPGE
ncbi:MAG: hypothetical protein F4Z10_03955 [Synechococcus sp. SB0666_bin_14]|nr:hypothetical protein [Synechococcus sp. SB0666_bin_14]MYA91029.1 hypothetical protein [Synechococcus sp. SB0663_bin_10]MYG46966.1 hypothetical protein [Synechococcus sp. SB0675_bin_6]MYJ60449.1 hypothetical protein [Synechococcus sp. SB0672_bin_6]MYK91765.1 hypothetical protein [Synechococcus sp. SB0669_bin_8]